METYWATVATVIPVVALAVIVEIRAYGQRWHEQPAWARSFQGFLWMMFLVGAVVAENVAVKALVRPDATASWASPVATNVISFGMILLVLTPAFELVFRISAPLIAAVISLHPRLLLTVLWLHRKSRWLHRDNQKRDKLRAEAIAKSRDKIREAEEEMELHRSELEMARSAALSPDIDAGRRAEAEAFVRKGEAWYADMSALVAELREWIAEAPPSRTEEAAQVLEEVQQAKKKLAAASAQQRKVWGDLLAAIPYGLNPLIPPPANPATPPATTTHRRARARSFKPRLRPRKRTRRS